MKGRAERIGFNEAVFREFNEQIHAVDQAFSVTTEEPLPLICECGDGLCNERIEMPGSAYEQLRSDPATFAVVPGHVTPDIEEVVARERGYEVVRKKPGTPREMAEASDPRS